MKFRRLWRLSVLATAMLMALPGLAQAADMGGLGGFGFKPYIGVGVGVYDLRFSGLGYNQSDNLTGGMVRVGADFNDYLGVELRYGTTERKMKPLYNIGGFNYGFSQKAIYLFSYLVKLQYPITQDFHAYGLLGGTTGRTSFMGATEYAGKVATGLSYGAGFDYNVDDFMSVGLEYMSYWDGVQVNKNNYSPYSIENAESYLATIKVEM